MEAASRAAAPQVLRLLEVRESCDRYSPADTPAVGNRVALRKCVPKRRLGTRGGNCWTWFANFSSFSFVCLLFHMLPKPVLIMSPVG